MNTKTILAIACIVIIVLLIANASKRERFTLCENGSCRGPRQIMKQEGLVAGQPLNNIEKPYHRTKGTMEVDILDDGMGGDAGLLYTPCSKSCCYQSPKSCGDNGKMNNGKFVPSSYKCNNSWDDSGCVCLTKKQSDFIKYRGGNA